MLSITKSIDEFLAKTKRFGLNQRLTEMAKLEFPFLEHYKQCTLMSIPTFIPALQPNLILASKKGTFVCSPESFDEHKSLIASYKKKKFGQSTIIIFLLLKKILKHYNHEFEKIRARMNTLDLTPNVDDIEHAGKMLRSLTDRFEELVRFMIILKEKEMKEFDTSLLPTEYDLLAAEVRYGLERCRSHVYRIASLRTKSEIESNKQLNKTMRRLTVITTFLAIIGIVVSVPGTIGAIFGIPALSDAYFKPHPTLLVTSLILATLISILFGLIYWRWLRMTKAF